jgi:hypothetical protein
MEKRTGVRANGLGGYCRSVSVGALGELRKKLVCILFFV